MMLRLERVVKSLNYENEDWQMWEEGYLGVYLGVRRFIKKVVLSTSFDYIILLCVVCNTVVLTLEGLVEEEESLNTMNTIFTVIFTIDMVLKVIGMGVKEYI